MYTRALANAVPQHQPGAHGRASSDGHARNALFVDRTTHRAFVDCEASYPLNHPIPHAAHAIPLQQVEVSEGPSCRAPRSVFKIERISVQLLLVLSVLPLRVSEAAAVPVVAMGPVIEPVKGLEAAWSVAMARRWPES